MRAGNRPGTKHFVLWYLGDTPNDDQISRDISDQIAIYSPRSGSAPFGWYVNPKMSVPEIFHVQVFWKRP